MKINTDRKVIEEIFSRGTVVEALPSRDEVMTKLTSGDRIRIYIGLDPTATAIHLGHAKNIMFLEEIRRLGHEVILLFGDFTARIGDPSDKKATRKQLTAEDVTRNVAGWMDQVRPILNFDDKDNPAKVMYNSKWLSDLKFSDILDIASNFTVQQMIERDMFQKRLESKAPIHLHEFMYPLMQGYDSVAMDVDAELCGTDQIFNAMAGRTLQKRYNNKDKFVIALNLLANPVTGELMSKSNGTGVFIDLPAAELYGAIMALPDPIMDPLYTNLTRLPLADKEKFMSKGPREAKASLAFDIVKRFRGEEAAKMAEEAFDKTFSKGGVPDDVREINLEGKSLAEALVNAGIVPSKAEWRRLIDGGAVKTDSDQKIDDPNFIPLSPTVLKIGKRRFVKVAP